MDQAEKIKVIANQFYANKTDKRSREEVYTHMIEWYAKRYLSEEFVSECYEAIEEGKIVEFQYKPGVSYTYLAGTKKAWDLFHKRDFK